MINKNNCCITENSLTYIKGSGCVEFNYNCQNDRQSLLSLDIYFTTTSNLNIANVGVPISITGSSTTITNKNVTLYTNQIDDYFDLVSGFTDTLFVEFVFTYSDGCKCTVLYKVTRCLSPRQKVNGTFNPIFEPFLTCTTLISCAIINSILNSIGIIDNKIIDIYNQISIIYNQLANICNNLSSGVWGSGSLDFPCDSTSGDEVYCDDNGKFRTKPNWFYKEHLIWTPFNHNLSGHPENVWINSLTTTITNNTCYSYDYTIDYLIRRQSFVSTVLNYHIEFSIDNGANWTFVSGHQGSMVQSGIMFDENTYPGFAGFILAPGDTVNVILRVKWFGLPSSPSDLVVLLMSSGLIKGRVSS